MCYNKSVKQIQHIILYTKPLSDDAETSGTMKFQNEDSVYLIGRVIGTLEPERDLAKQEDVEKYYSIRQRKE